MDKIAFELGPLSIHWYGILMAVGFLAGLWTASRRSVRDGLQPEQVLDLGPWLILGAIIGARSLYVISYWNEFADKPWTEVLMVHHGGLVFYGGFLGATVAGVLYVQIKKLPIWKVADAVAPSISLGYVFGRMGCLLNGCCFGRACELPWAIHYPDTHSTRGLGVHPTQVYDSLLNLGLYLGLVWLYRRKKFDGQVFAAYVVCYAVVRAIVEVFRGDYPRYYLGGLVTPAQLLSAAILIAGLILFWKLPRRSPAGQ